MTVVSTVVRAAAAWTGAETEIPTGIQVQERSQLVVSLVPDEGERQALTLGLHYTIKLSSAGVATVVPLAAFPAKPGTVSMVRQTPMTQVYDPTATDTYDAEGHAAALDRSAMRVAELSQKVDDIAAEAIVVTGGGGSVPDGAVYVSDGKGQAVAGPSAAEIEKARATAVATAAVVVEKAEAATTAAGVASGSAEAAAASAAKAAEIAARVAEFGVTSFNGRSGAVVPKIGDYSPDQVGAAPVGRKIKVGKGLLLDGVAGSDAAPVESDLSKDLLFGLDMAALSGLLKNARLVTASGNVRPSAGVTKWLGFLVGGGQASQSMHVAGAGGAGCLFICAVSDASSCALTVGGVGGNSSLTVGATTYTANGSGGVATNGILNLAGQPGGLGSYGQTNDGVASFGLGPAGGDGPFGLGHGGQALMMQGYTYGNGNGWNGFPGIGYGAGGGSPTNVKGGAAGAQGAGTPGCLLLLEF